MLDGREIETVKEFEQEFKVDANAWKDNSYSNIDPDSCLCQLDLISFMSNKSDRFRHRDMDWVEKRIETQRPSFLKVRAWSPEAEQYADLSSIYTRIELSDTGELRIFDSRGLEDSVIEFSTTVKDSKGKEIHQGDIVRENQGFSHPVDWEVIWDHDGFMLVHAQREGDEFGVYKCFLHRAKNLTIVGNIHEGIKELVGT